MLPEHIINKIMLYVSHPVADVFKKHVSILPEITEQEIEEQIVENKLETIEEDLETYDTWECKAPWFIKRIYTLRNLDPTFKKRYKKIIDDIADECKYYAEGYGGDQNKLIHKYVF